MFWMESCSIVRGNMFSYRREVKGNHCVYTFGAGTKVEIKRAQAQPSAYIFQPSQEQLRSGSATLVCMINGFYPSNIDVKWRLDGVLRTDDVQNSLSEQDSKDSTYSLSSTLTLPSTEYNQYNTFTCEVAHQSLSSPLTKSFNKQEC